MSHMRPKSAEKSIIPVVSRSFFFTSVHLPTLFHGRIDLKNKKTHDHDLRQ